jgi:nitroimidazol reductase NimA-like FMN-containing flavoprotein (pyridoxamine 5'-phosphate oxidase superfamily)
MELTDEQRVYLEYARVCRLATVDGEGQPHVVPVCPILVDGKIYVASEDNRKVRNVRGNPKVALAYDDYVEDWTALRGITVFGTLSRIIDRGPDFALLVEAFYAKFPQYAPQAGPITEENSVILEIAIDRVSGEL